MDFSSFLAKANENFNAAQLCFDNKLFNASANRSYYAMLQIAIAILIKKGFPPQRKNIDHGWVQSAFARELIHRRKIFQGKLKAYLTDAQNVRNIADYDVAIISRKKASQQLKKTKEFIDVIKLELISD